MTYHALVHFPEIDTNAIQALREKYDPTAALIAPHVTVMFPLNDADVSEPVLVQHLEKVIARWRPFPMRLGGLMLSWDQWLFLLLQAGDEEFRRLNSEVYGDILAPYHRTDVEFIPHISLGALARGAVNFANPAANELDTERYATALTEAEAAGLDAECRVEKVTLVALTDNFRSCESVRDFVLGGG